MANEATASDWRALAKWHCKPTLVAVQVLTKDTRDTCACALAMWRAGETVQSGGMGNKVTVRVAAKTDLHGEMRRKDYEVV